MNGTMTVGNVTIPVSAAIVRAAESFRDFGTACKVLCDRPTPPPEPTPARVPVCTVSLIDADGKWRVIRIFPRQPKRAKTDPIAPPVIDVDQIRVYDEDAAVNRRLSEALG